MIILLKKDENMEIKRKKKKNKKLIFVILALLVLLPTVAALFVLIKTYPGSLRASAIGKICVTNPNGEVFEYIEESDLKFFATVYNSSPEIETPAHDTSEYREFNMKIDRTADDIVCDILLTDTSEDCLLRFMSDGAPVYKNILPEHAAVILADENFATAYTYYMPPKLNVSIGEKTHLLAPYEMNWSYRKNDGEFYPTDTSGFISDKKPSFEYRPEKYISLSFELAPDLLSVQIFDGDDTVFADKYDSQNYRSFTYNKKANLKYIFTAEWIATSSARYSGKAVYELNVKYIVDPVGIASSNKITEGEFIAYTVNNTADGEALRVEGDRSLSFFTHNDSKLLFYPSYPGGATGQKTLTVADSDGNTLSEIIEILPSPEKDAYILHESIPKELYIINYADMSETATNLRSYTVSENPKLWDGKFTDPADGMNILLDYATPITSDGEQIGNSSFMLISPSSDDIRAIGNGKVVFSGDLMPYGKTVIIDHGLGICSFYANLEDCLFVRGDEVTKGMTVATINSAGYALMYGVSVNGYFVNPSALNSCLELALLI